MNRSEPLALLLVEDDPSDAALVESALRQVVGIRSLQRVATLREARDFFSSRQPDVVLLDLSLPDAQGVEAVETMRRIARAVPIVVLSGDDDPELSLLTLEAGAQDYLLKGRFDGDALLRAARHARVRAQLEARLSGSQQQLEMALAGADLGLWDWHIPTGIVIYNERWAAMLGYRLEELKSHLSTWESLLHPDDEPAVHVALERHFRGESSIYESEHRLLHREGHWVWVLDRGKVVERGEDGLPLRAVGTHLDITQRKHAEQELLIAATAFESQEGMLVTDPAGIILRVNRAFTELTGYQPGEALGRRPALLKSGLQNDAFYRQMWEQLEREGTWQGEIWNRRKNGELYAEWLTITAVTGAAGKVTHYVGAFLDITQRKLAEEQIRSLAFYDPLTGLPNRRLLLDRLARALAFSARTRRYGALMFLDLDHFKTLNDTRGHNMGDHLLVEVARRLGACVRDGDTVARMGGDEFVIMLEGLGEVEEMAAAQVEAVAEKVRSAIDEPYYLKCSEADGTPEPYHCTASIGISLFRDRGERSEELIKRADVAMYEAKSAGRNLIRFFDPKMQAEIEVRAALESELRRAAEKGELRLFFQPQVDGSKRIIGAEALLRWQHPSRGLILPGQFIPLAEDTGQIIPIGLWVLEQACLQLKRWEANEWTRNLQLAVNVSPRQFRQADFVEQVLIALARTGANPVRLKLELTESMVLHDVEETVRKMEQLRSAGVTFSMDDFGTGYSSLSSLHRLPLDQLKIDRSFIHHMMEEPSNAVIVQTIITMGRTLGLHVIAEGVENEEQCLLLDGNGCDAFQGFLFGRPVEVEEFEGYVERLRRLA